MGLVYYAYTDVLKKINLENLTTKLSLRAKSKLAGYLRNEDKLLLLTSSVLLLKALLENGFEDYKLCDLQLSTNGRPFFTGSPFDFNISHTANCAALVFSTDCRVGIDIEKIKELDFSDYKEIFSQELWNKIYSSADMNRTFYNYWTLMESAIKADGRGLSLISANKIEIINDQLMIDGKEWFSDHPNFDSSIACCITSNKENESMVLRKIQAV